MSRISLILLMSVYFASCGNDAGKIEARTRQLPETGDDATAKGKIEPKIRINGKIWDGKSDLESASVQVFGY